MEIAASIARATSGDSTVESWQRAGQVGGETRSAPPAVLRSTAPDSILNVPKGVTLPRSVTSLGVIRGRGS